MSVDLTVRERKWVFYTLSFCNNVALSRNTVKNSTGTERLLTSVNGERRKHDSFGRVIKVERDNKTGRRYVVGRKVDERISYGDLNLQESSYGVAAI